MPRPLSAAAVWVQGPDAETVMCAGKVQAGAGLTLSHLDILLRVQSKQVLIRRGWLQRGSVA